MKSSIQVITGPLLRQFATTLNADEVALTTKLGGSTISRVRFRKLAFPNDPALQHGFVESLVDKAYPTARQELKNSFRDCIADQVTAFKQLVGDNPPI